MANNSEKKATETSTSTPVELNPRYANCVAAQHIEVYHPVSAQMGKAEQSWDVKRHARIYIDESKAIAHIELLDPVDSSRPIRSSFSIPFSNVAWYVLA